MAVSLTRSRGLFNFSITLAVIMLFATASTSHANVTSTLISETYYFGGAGYGGHYLDVAVSGVYIDPTVTNWVAWHDHTTPDVKSGKEYVGSYTWLGTDDYFYLTIKKDGGGTSSSIRMDYNSSYGTASGPQAVIYGTAADAPNVERWNFSQTHITFDEAGAFNSFFDAEGAGNYNFLFAFWDGYSGSYGIPFNMYLLVDSSQVIIPAPGAFLLGGIGVVFVGWMRRRRTI